MKRKKARIERPGPGLIALDGGPDFVLGRGLMILGRDPLCDIRVDSPKVSRVHCCLARRRGVVIVRDLVSTNGTAVNGRRTWSGRLRAGDELSVAGLRYRLEAPPGAPEAHRPPTASRNPPPD